MAHSRQLRFGAFMRPVSIHTAAWRYPGAFPDANFNFAHYKRFVQTLERGRFDAFFMADHLAVMNMPMNALKRSATVTSFDPDDFIRIEVDKNAVPAGCKLAKHPTHKAEYIRGYPVFADTVTCQLP